MIFRHNTTDLDPTLEHEIVDPKGMQVIILFKNGKQEIYNDITEVHWKFPPFGDSVALESDIQQTGFTPRIDRIERLNILDKVDVDAINDGFEKDLKEIAHWFGGWGELRKLIDRMEEDDAEAAFERSQL